ncbi:MAG: AAA family ATPase [Caldilineaceae bacterium]
MFLKEVILQNFRGYKARHRIAIEQLTAFIGKNDAGKSSIFDAIAVFFDHPLGKIDSSDICVHTEDSGELRIGCVFTDFPETITIDATSETTLQNEYLLNANGELEIHKVYGFSEGNLKKGKIVAIYN